MASVLGCSSPPCSANVAALAQVPPASLQAAGPDAKEPQRPVPLPMVALLQRMGSGAFSQPWAGFLPRGLKPPETAPWRARCNGSGVSGGVSDSTSDSLRTSYVPPLDRLALAGRVWSLSQEAVGCRQVQQALDQATSDECREAIVAELHGHVLEACKCPHANHVMQKCIATLPCGALQFVIDELVESNIGQIARHKFGCRILQRLIEFCPNDQVRGLVEPLLDSALALVRHAYGNYTIQMLIQHGTDEDRSRILEVLMENVRHIAAENYGCSVLSSALSHGAGAGAEPQRRLAEALLGEPGLLAFLAGSRHGHVAAGRILDVLEGPALHDAVEQLGRESASLSLSKYGQEVLDKALAVMASDVNGTE